MNINVDFGKVSRRIKSKDKGTVLLSWHGIHFNSTSCRELGKRYFEKYKDVRERNH